ncbi:MAG TPA: hypothetical protein VLJ86_22665 [Ramlibacter sp.]|nr:hypothetical protein [Ramlibacter sp.]
MPVARNASIVLALGLAVSGAMGGEIQGYSVVSTGAVNASAGSLATARQNIGVVDNSTVMASGAGKVADGSLSTARLQIVGAQGDGKPSNPMFVARDSGNTAGGFQSTAAQRTGVAE